MMATDGLGVISDDGKTVSYSVGIELTGTGAALDRPCGRCGSVVLRRPGSMKIGDNPTTKHPVIIDYCTNEHCTQ